MVKESRSKGKSRTGKFTRTERKALYDIGKEIGLRKSRDVSDEMDAEEEYEIATGGRAEDDQYTEKEIERTVAGELADMKEQDIKEYLRGDDKKYVQKLSGEKLQGEKWKSAFSTIKRGIKDTKTK